MARFTISSLPKKYQTMVHDLDWNIGQDEDGKQLNQCFLEDGWAVAEDHVFSFTTKKDLIDTLRLEAYAE